MEKSIDKKFLELVSGLLYPKWTLESLSTITPDASMRRYFRASVRSDSRTSTLVVMQFLSLSNPEASGAESIPPDRAVVELSAYFTSQGIAVPKLQIDAREHGILIIEDIGTRTLGNLHESTDDFLVTEYYKKAVDQLLEIQNCPKQDSFFFNRSFTFAQYIKEMEEFLDFSFAPKGYDSTLLIPAFRQLAEELDKMPRVLAHRDFHSWNLMLDEDDTIRVIDFQDALMATRCYDIVALLNDRSTDLLLGPSLYQVLLRYYFASIDYKDVFFDEYDRVLLQRDLKVVGRFAKLSKLRGLAHYEQWIPSTLNRIGTTLNRLKGSSPSYANLLDILSAHYPEVKEGSGEHVTFLEER